MDQASFRISLAGQQRIGVKLMEIHQGHTLPPESNIPVELDTTTPAEGIVTRFTQNDWPRYAAWLAARVALRWDHISPHQVPQLMSSYMGSNDSAIFKTDESVSLVQLVMLPFEKQPIARQVFLFTNGKQAHKDAVKLVREQELWAKRLGASRLVLDNQSDFTPGTYKKMSDAKEEVIIYREII